MIIYDGLSEINSEPIVAILTDNASKNRKTGPMGQFWIMPQAVSPVVSVKTGYDAAVCGSCVLRRSDGGPCYVNAGHGPEAIWKAWLNGSYIDNTVLTPTRALRRLKVRLGAWGDPAALPFWVVEDLLNIVQLDSGHTGYTHQWRTCDERFKYLVMASCESEADYYEAKAQGWRTFRIVSDYSELLPTERICAFDSHEVQCIDCMACHGGYGADIAIKVHGTMAGKRWDYVQQLLLNSA